MLSLLFCIVAVRTAFVPPVFLCVLSYSIFPVRVAIFNSPMALVI